ncbi:MAG TPA: hypothetical protein VLJ14_02090 [Ktedonobacterales bacterium]|nr:hypothetical protein [Ktedonobacterales bacterium]
MTVILADHDIERHARLLFATLQALDWAQLLDIHLAGFNEVGLVETSSDREVWRRVQQLDMLLLTNNRNKEGSDSLEQTLREELTSTSLPVLTIGNAERFLASQTYRERCANRVAEIAEDLDRATAALPGSSSPEPPGAAPYGRVVRCRQFVPQ